MKIMCALSWALSSLVHVTHIENDCGCFGAQPAVGTHNTKWGKNRQTKFAIEDTNNGLRAKNVFGANRGISTHIQTHVRCVWMHRDVKCSPGNVNYTKRIRYDLRVFIFTETVQRYLFGWAHAACHTLNKTHQNGINLIVIWTHFMNQLTHTYICKQTSK